MSLASHIQAWRLFRGQSVHALTEKSGLSSASLDAIESGQLDPSASTLEGLAAAMEIPPPWLYMDPKHWVLLTQPEKVGETTPENSIDQVTEQVLRGAEQERELYVLLTAVLQSGEPKLRLATQARQLTVPWQGRPPGHVLSSTLSDIFEPRGPILSIVEGYPIWKRFLGIRAQMSARSERS